MVEQPGQHDGLFDNVEGRVFVVDEVVGVSGVGERLPETVVVAVMVGLRDDWCARVHVTRLRVLERLRGTHGCTVCRAGGYAPAVDGFSLLLVFLTLVGDGLCIPHFLCAPLSSCLFSHCCALVGRAHVPCALFPYMLWYHVSVLAARQA